MLKFLFCLAGVGVLLPALTHTSPTDTELINQALQAAENLTQALRNDTFNSVLTTFDAAIPAWTAGMDRLFFKLDFIDPELKQRYLTVNDELGNLLQNLVEMRDKINWKGTSLAYPKIEDEIYKLDQKLRQVFEMKPTSSIKQDFRRYYDKSYDLEAIDLFHATVDGRLLDPVLEHTQADKQPTQAMMRGLIVLMLKGATLEIADQNFRRNKRNEVAIWRKRLQKFRIKLKETDATLKSDWQKCFRGEVDAIVAAHQNESMERLRDVMYSHMTTKYHWRKWAVVAYVYGNMPAYSTYNQTFVYNALVNTKPTFIMVATTDADSDFDVEHARRAIATPVDSYGCRPGGNSMLCYYIGMPELGLMSLIVPSRYAHAGPPDALAHGRGSFTWRGGAPAAGPPVFYFG